MKRGKYLFLLVYVLVLVGCSKEQVLPDVDEEIKLETCMTTAYSNEQEKTYQFEAEDFEPVLIQYFSFTDSELLKLNQMRSEVDEDYWNNLSQNYSLLIKKKLGSYLAPELIRKIEKQYLYDKLNMPKWIKLNEYIISGHAVVEGIKIQSIQDLGDEMLYEIAVITTNGCYLESAFYEKYRWNETINYWEEKVEKNHQKDDASLLEEKDEVKLEQILCIAVKKQKKFQITRMNNRALWGVDTKYKAHWLDTQYITRLPYKQQITNQEKATLNKVFEYIMGSYKEDMTYYEKTYDTSSKLFAQMWYDAGLINEISINEENYLQYNPKTIMPYKDDIVQLEMMPQDIGYIPSAYGTKNHPKYIVVIPMKALRNNHQIVYYNYKYFVGMEKGKVHSIQFLEMEPIRGT
ncbi:MAG: hypothetical protein J6F30_05370 [Cellulosilyticum sp.]|nr:hypothetical protein [Cellulosilyticum sp.]